MDLSGTRLAAAGPRLGAARKTAEEVWRNPAPWARGARAVVIAAVFLLFIRILFGQEAFDFFHPAQWPSAIPNLDQGIALGSLYGIIGVGIILIYRTARLINFAAGAIGAVPAILALLLDLQDHVSYLLVAPIVLVGGPVFGALVEIVVMRRYARSPRLIATVITIGVAQTLAILGFFIPIWLGQKANNVQSLVPTPWDKFIIHNHRGQPALDGNQIAAILAVLVVTVGLGAFFRYTRMGIALRASAENADRASLLGIPVKRVATTAWALAGLLSAVAIFVQAPLTGTPSDATLGFDTLLYGLAAAVVAKMQSFTVALASGVAIGIIITSSIVHSGDDSVSSSIMLLLILAALLVQRRQMARALDTGEGTWQTVKQFRPIPVELRSLPEVVRARAAMFVAAVGLMVALPFIAGANNISYLILLPLYGIVGVSMVVLTGWAGQISLGQFGLVGVAAGVSGGLVANHNIDFFVALGLGVATGVVAAVIIGLPAVRIQGLYLAVTTLAFSYAVQNFVLNKHYFIGKHIMPSGDSSHLYRPILYGVINLSGDRAFYYVCLVFLALTMAAALSFRRNRSGRVLIAARDNQRAATAYAINLARTRLAAFAVSGGIAGVAGVLFAYAQRDVVPGSYSVEASILVFLAAAIAGVSSVSWSVFGVMALEASVAFGPRLYDLTHSQTLESILPLLLTGPLLLINQYFYPGGSAQSGYDRRDGWLRKLANRHGIVVPSLVADVRVDEKSGEDDVIVAAERHVEVMAGSEEEPTGAAPKAGRSRSAAPKTGARR